MSDKPTLKMKKPQYVGEVNYGDQMSGATYLKQRMFDECGGGGGGNPAIEVYNRWQNLLGDKALADLIKLAEAANGVKGLNPSVLPGLAPEAAKDTVSTAAFWSAVKYVFTMQLNNAYAETAASVKVNKQNWANFVSQADSDPATKAALMTMGLMVVVVGSPVLLF